MRGLLLLGTDTGVGKTAFAQGLLRLALRRGLRLMPFKPVETGWSADTSDARLLCLSAGLPATDVSEVCPYRYQLAAAPSVAARAEGRPIDVAHLGRKGSAVAARGEALLVESAGGVLTPYTQDGFTSATLATLFDIDVLLVSANRLGTISHTALAVAELTRQVVRFKGIVLVDTSATPGADHSSNAAEITALTGILPLGLLRHCPSPTPDHLADAVAKDIDLSRLLDGAFGMRLS